jgi:hypothetical protein
VLRSDKVWDALLTGENYQEAHWLVCQVAAIVPNIDNLSHTLAGGEFVRATVPTGDHGNAIEMIRHCHVNEELPRSMLN